MIDVMNVRCPHCDNKFDVDIYVGEEASKWDANLTKSMSQRVSWQEIDREIQSGNAALLFSVEDKLTFQLKDGMVVSVCVAAINPGGQNKVAFTFDKLYWKGSMNRTDTTRGGWANCKLADDIENNILPLLPDELVAVIKDREIAQRVNGTIYKRTSKLWIPSYTEVYGYENWNSCDIDDVQFDFFKKWINRIGIMAKDDIIEWTWRRSVRSATDFAIVGVSGGAGSSGASHANGVRPLFFI